MKWWQWFLVFVAWTGVVFVAGHSLWPARELVEIPGAVVLDSAAVQALEVRLDSVRAELVHARANVAHDRVELTRARTLYADLARRLDSFEQAPAEVPVEWPAAAYDTTVQRVTSLVVQVGDSTWQRDITQEIRMNGKYLFPPIGTFADLGVHVTPSAVYFSRQLPGRTIETREVVRWDLVVAAGGISAAIVAIIALFVR